MLIITGAFSDEDVSLDEKHFKDCTLINCTLSYDGGRLILERTRITGCNYLFGAAAQRTVSLLQTVGVLGESFSIHPACEELVN